MVETENESKNLISPSQSLRRKSGAVPVKKFPSLQVSHYPVLLCSHNDDEANQLKSSVIWKASSNTDSPPPFKEAASETTRKTSARANDSSGSFERPLSPNAPSPCSPSRLLPPRKLSFSTVVNMKTAAHNNVLGSPSIRCQSSASPMTASERQLLWNTVHHDSLKSSISMESMYNSCTDLDMKFRQQRKRRAGISSGSAAITRGGAFASAGGSGCNSAGYSTGRSQPPLGGRSPQSSFDSNSNQDVAQISMNWMRMNGLGAGSIRPFLTGNPPSSHSSTHLSRVGSLRKMHCVTSLEGQLPRSGTQCDVLNAENATGHEIPSNAGLTHSTVTTPELPLADTCLMTTSVPSDATPRGILRAPRLQTAPKQLSFDFMCTTSSPVPSAKSSCVSQSGSYHMFEKPPRCYPSSTSPSMTPSLQTLGVGRRGSSRRKDPGRFRLQNLQQRSNSESTFRMPYGSTSTEYCQGGVCTSRCCGNHDPSCRTRRMSMAYLPSKEQALLRRILGPQGLSWINSDRKRSVPQGEIASRKSVSIAYSNDIEGQKNADDSETPLMEEKEDNSGGRLIKREQLHEKRRITCDRALTFAVLGIVLMMIESELRSNNFIDAGSLESLALKACILGSTLVLIVYVGYFHVIDVQLFMNANAADDWRVSLTTHRVTQILIELMICAVCPLPLELGTYSSIDTHNTLHSLNVLFSISMFFRLYWLCRVMLLHSRLFTDASSRSIAGLNRVNFNARFILKTLMTLCPGKMLIIFTASLWIIAGWILRLCEREMSIPRTRELDYGSSIWLVAITFLSVGYGDIVPHTQCGRVMAVITGILGTCTSSMVVAVITRKLELTRAEKHVHSFMMDTQLTKQLKHSAANVLRETWLIYKYRKLVDKADLSKIRQHQRKFLVAIYELRKVKRDQRKLTENLVSLGDVAKTSSSAYELMHDVHSTQEGLSLRITAIEHQLSDISREIGSLAELLRGRKSSMTSEEASPQHRMRLRTITDD
ncbi:unnamed protein product [Auanema sp. JU1783]|nr:unnamed protein product [Auanema sp. JU1783]